MHINYEICTCIFHVKARSPISKLSRIPNLRIISYGFHSLRQTQHQPLWLCQSRPHLLPKALTQVGLLDSWSASQLALMFKCHQFSANIGCLRRGCLNPILDTRISSVLLRPSSRSDYPPWILIRIGLESSGQRLISSIGKTKRIAFLLLCFFFGKKKIYF